MKTLLYLTNILLLTFLIGCQSNEEVEVDYSPSNSKNIRNVNLCDPKVMSYHFGLEHLPTTDQATTLRKLNIDGIIVQIESNNLATLDDLYLTKEVNTGQVHVYDVFTSLQLDDSLLYEQQISTIEAIYSRIQHNETILQVLFYGTASDEFITSTLSRLSDIAKSYNKEILIYPHFELRIQNAEEAMTYIELSERDNIYLSLHLSHELAAGNGHRITTVIKNVAPYIKSVSINGASLEEQSDTTLALWYWGIKPIYSGTYNYKPFYEALINHNYRGPIAIHTWGILNNFGLTAENYLPTAKNTIIDLANSSCQK